MSELTKNGFVTRNKDGSSSYRVNNAPEVKASTVVHSGHICTIRAQEQIIIVGDAAFISNSRNASVSVETNDGDSTNFATDNQGNTGFVGDSTLNRLSPYNPISQLVQAVTGNNQMNTAASSHVAATALRQVGVTCTNPDGKPSAPVLSVGDVRKLAEVVVRK